MSMTCQENSRTTSLSFQSSGTHPSMTMTRSDAHSIYTVPACNALHP